MGTGKNLHKGSHKMALKNLKKSGFLLLTVAGSSVIASSALADSMPRPSAEVAVSSVLIRKLTEMPIQQSQNIDMVVDGAHVVSQITGTGLGYISPWQTGLRGLGFCIDAQSTINANIDATIAGPARVFVNTDAVAVTTTNSRKCFLLNDNELKSYAAKTNAGTRLTVQNLNVWAGGLFPRLKTRIGIRKAQKEIAARIPQQEAEISAQAVQTINSMLDQKTVDLKRKVDHEWNTWVADATIKSRLLPRPPQLHSTNEALYVYVPTDTKQHQLELAPRGSEAAIVRLKSQYLKDAIKPYLAGQTGSDIDLLSALVKQEGDFASPEELLGTPDEILVRFNRDLPVDFTFDDGVITAILRFDSLKTNGQEFGAVDMVFPVRVSSDPVRGALVEIPETLSFKDRATGAALTELNEICSARWSVVATTRQFSLEEIRKQKAAWLPVRFMSLIADNDALTLTATNGQESEFAAIRRNLTDKFKL
jgi:hypothetical protein